MAIKYLPPWQLANAVNTRLSGKKVECSQPLGIKERVRKDDRNIIGKTIMLPEALLDVILCPATKPSLCRGGYNTQISKAHAEVVQQ